MDWGLGNPNKTAGLIAALMVLVWALVCFRRWGFWMALVLFTGLGICLIHTFSRGGLLALLVGIAPVLWRAVRPWPVDKIISVLISVAIILAAAFYFKADSRFGQGILKEDRSITHRMQIWKYAPQMIVASPKGWGLGNSGQAYMNWYQPLHDHERYRTLVNSHLTWLVEMGWPLRFLYLFLWGTVLLICWPRKTDSWTISIAFGIWITLFVSATFSSVAECPWLWLCPLLTLIGTLVYRIATHRWPAPREWLTPAEVSLVILSLIFVIGENTEVKIIGRTIIFGKGDPGVWLVPDIRVTGRNYGRILRQYSNNNGLKGGAIGFADSETALPEISGKTVIIAGDRLEESVFKQTYLSALKIILLNPTLGPQELGLAADHASSIEVVFGEFSRSLAVGSWNEYASVRQIMGASDYLSDWPSAAFDKSQ